MQALEFIATVEDGVIKLPKKYVGKFRDPVRIILLTDEAATIEASSSKKKPKRKREFKAVVLDTRGFIFNRDEANER